MRSGAAVVICVTALLAAGCGTGGIAKGGDPGKGGTLFVQKCGSCHTLSAAQTKGAVGPNLDDAFASDRGQGYKDSTIQQVVRDQIEIAGGRMPANLVTGSSADDVAAYVAACAAIENPGSSCHVSAAVGPALPGLAGKGQKLYVSLGCQGCHTTDGSKSTGPSFKGLYGRRTKLTNGQTVTANMAYLLDSIRDPDKQIVQGYSPGIMSSAIKPGSVSTADAKALIAFIKTLK
ncbi:MAG: cytochrome c [Actinobacteria bacterium]|nr:MAG: cytochrome c [Actinomycetota bacterium]